MLKQVRGLGIDLERVLLIEQAQVERLIVHAVNVLQTTTRSQGKALMTCGSARRSARIARHGQP
jgi:hypothetical protein